jgi:hypothetical protein
VDLDSQERKESRAQNFTAAPIYRFDGKSVILHEYIALRWLEVKDGHVWLSLFLFCHLRGSSLRY